VSGAVSRNAELAAPGGARIMDPASAPGSGFVRRR
jgi:hypothetical protein